MRSAVSRRVGAIPARLSLARRALGAWGARQVVVAFAGALGVGLVIGLATVLIPNSVFGREIPPVWWDYPVWILTSVLCGVLIATYVDPDPQSAVAADGTDRSVAADDETMTRRDRRTNRMGAAGGVLAWFAVGCPVCNKIALVALGYSGALTWFAPMQPFLAAIAVVLTVVAILLRLEGQVVCAVPVPRDREPVGV